MVLKRLRTTEIGCRGRFFSVTTVVDPFPAPPSRIVWHSVVGRWYRRTPRAKRFRREPTDIDVDGQNKSVSISDLGLSSTSIAKSFCSCRTSATASHLVARERADRRHFRDAPGPQGEERVAPGTTGTASPEHSVHLSSVQQPAGAAHFQRRIAGHDTWVQSHIIIIIIIREAIIFLDVESLEPLFLELVGTSQCLHVSQTKRIISILKIRTFDIANTTRISSE